MAAAHARTPPTPADASASNLPSVDGLAEQTLRAILRGELAPENHPRLVKAGSSWLDKDAAKQLEKMTACARDPACNGLGEPLPLYVCSRYRSFNAQRFSWFRNLKRYGDRATPTAVARRAVKFLALPGTSRHHWGTDIDVSYVPGKCKLSNHYFRSRERATARCEHLKARCEAEAKAGEACRAPESDHAAQRTCRRELRRCASRHEKCPRGTGSGARLYDWLYDHAEDYGFCQPYRGLPDERNPGLTDGYAEEHWHWSYCCRSDAYTKAYAARRDVLAPTFGEVFGEGRDRGKAGAARRQAYEEFVLPSFRERVVNIHDSCRRCAAKCPKQAE